MRVERAIVRQRVGDVKTVLPVMHSDIRTTLNVYGDVVTDETAQAYFEAIAAPSRIRTSSTLHRFPFLLRS